MHSDAADQRVEGPHSTRLPALDAAKGIAIVLVIVFHIWGGLIVSHRLTSTPLYVWLNAYVYTFHVPVFFFVAGLVLPDPRRAGFFASIGRRLVYPYVIWSVFQGLVIAAAGENAHDPISPADVIPSMIFHPRHQFWFLHALIVTTVLVGAAARLDCSRRDIFLGSALLFGIQLAVPCPYIVRSVARWSFYLTAGFWLGLPKTLPPRWMALPAFGALALAVSLNAHLVEVLQPMLAALGILGTLAIAGGWSSGPLCSLGRASLGLYLAHVLAAAPARLLPLPLPTGVALGIGIPYLLWHFAEAWALPIFRWPARRAANSGG